MTLRKEIEGLTIKSMFKNPNHYTLNEQDRVAQRTSDQICSLIKERLEWMNNSRIISEEVENLIKELGGE